MEIVVLLKKIVEKDGFRFFIPNKVVTSKVVLNIAYIFNIWFSNKKKIYDLIKPLENVAYLYKLMIIILN